MQLSISSWPWRVPSRQHSLAPVSSARWSHCPELSSLTPAPLSITPFPCVLSCGTALMVNGNGPRWTVWSSCPQGQRPAVFGFQAAAAQVRTTSHSCVQMFFPSGSRCVSCLLVTKVQRVLFVAVSDLSLLATDRSCADWKGLGGLRAPGSCCACGGGGAP